MKFNIDKIIKLKKERELYIKTWLFKGLFGYHKFKENKKFEGYLYLILTTISLLLISLSLFFLFYNTINELEYKNVIFLFCSGLIINVIVTIMWVKDLLKYTSIIDKEIQQLENGE